MSFAGFSAVVSGGWVVTLAILASWFGTVRSAHGAHVAALPEVSVNTHERAAGTRRGAVQQLSLELRRATWHPNGPTGIAIDVPVFGETGRAPQLPGPMLRVAAGTPLQIAIVNRLNERAIVYGLHEHDGRTDSLVLAPGDSQSVRFVAARAGTFMYWARTTTTALRLSRRDDSQLVGAFIVDSVGSASATRDPKERVLVVTSWEDSIVNTRSPYGTHQIYAINGRSWPHTERLTYTRGDTVRWRIINASQHTHPMHLHGFHFSVLGRGNFTTDTTYTRDMQRDAVTEYFFAGTTLRMQWVAERAGNWLYHCHSINHIDEALRLDDIIEGPISHAHVTDAMAGLVAAITVREKRATPAPRGAAAAPTPERSLRLFVTQRASPIGAQPAMSYVLQRDTREPASDSLEWPGSPLVLQRNEPTRITVINRSARHTAVHWHGMELESYYDGVAGWSGADSRTAPIVAPGDSFVVRFTPPRSGSFLYHTHAGELAQLTGGLYGPLFVQDDRTARDSLDRVFVFSDSTAAVLYNNAPVALVNGRSRTDTLRLRAGVTYRLRFLTITGVSNRRLRMLESGAVMRWTPVAKDGADLRPARRVPVVADQILGPGETLDVLYTPTAVGVQQFEVSRLFGPAQINPIVVLVAPSR